MAPESTDRPHCGQQLLGDCSARSCRPKKGTCRLTDSGLELKLRAQSIAKGVRSRMPETQMTWPATWMTSPATRMSWPVARMSWPATRTRMSCVLALASSWRATWVGSRGHCPCCPRRRWNLSRSCRRPASRSLGVLFEVSCAEVPARTPSILEMGAAGSTSRTSTHRLGNVAAFLRVVVADLEVGRLIKL